MTPQSLPTETFAAAKPRIDKFSGIIYGVSVIAEGEAQGHGIFIDQKTLKSVSDVGASHPGGVRVKMQHGTDFEAIVGKLQNFRIDGGRVRADFHLLKEHPRYASILELAKKMPTICGFSISFRSDKEEIDGKKFIRVTELFSVDLVDTPAANPTGLFSAPPQRLTGLALVEASFRAQREGTTTSLAAGDPKQELFGLARVEAAFRSQHHLASK